MNSATHHSAAAALLLFTVSSIGCSHSSPTKSPPESPAIQYTCQVVNTYPHDTSAFTEGLQWVDTLLYESTGLYGSSSLRLVRLETGQVLYRRPLPDHPGGKAYFGEGVCVVGDSIYQLTWQSHIGFIYNKNTFDSVGYFRYPTEGWGLTFDGSRFIMSDGSSRLYFWSSLTCHDCDTVSLSSIPSVRVHDSGTYIASLNELEYINGEVYANIWQTNRIARINPSTGAVTGWIDVPQLLTAAEQANADVLNGIAYDSTGERLFLTGKYWPKLFEVKLVKTDSVP